MLEALEHAIHLAAHGRKDISRTGHGGVGSFGDFGLSHCVLLCVDRTGLHPVQHAPIRLRPLL